MVFFEIFLFIFLKMLAPDLLMLALIASTSIFCVTVFTLSFALIVLSTIINHHSITEVLKNKGNYRLLSISAGIILSIIFILFVNGLALNHDNQKTVHALNRSQIQWKKISNFELLGFNSLSTSSRQQQSLSDNLLKTFQEDQMFLSMLSPNSNDANNNTSNHKSLFVNPTYFEYQSIYDRKHRLEPSDFSNAFTLLTTPNSNINALKKDYASYLKTDPGNIKIRLIPNQSFYAYLTLDDFQDQSFQHPNQVLVINLHAIQYVDHFMSQNIVSWATQRQLMFKINPNADIKQSFPSLSSNLSDVSQTTKFRSELSHQIYFQKIISNLNLVLSILVTIIASYFTTYILFAARRKQLFILQIYGASFLKRYSLIYLALIATLIPGMILALMNGIALFTITMIIISMLCIFTLQIYGNEKSTYRVLKGKI